MRSARHLALLLLSLRGLPRANGANGAEGTGAGEACGLYDDPAMLQLSSHERHDLRAGDSKVARRPPWAALPFPLGTAVRKGGGDVPGLIRDALALGMQVVQCRSTAADHKDDPCAPYVHDYFQKGMPTPAGSNIPSYSPAELNPSNDAFIVQRNTSKAVAIADVQAYIGLCNKYSVTPNVKSSGSSLGRWSGYGRVPLVLQPNHFEIDSGRHRVTLDSAHKMRDFYEMLGEQERRGWGHWLTVGGSCAQVSLGGFLQGGGHSSVSRAFGLPSDSVISAEVVLADASLVTASATSHPDLFWALQGGGGGNWGVVVSFILQLHEYPHGMQFYMGILPYDVRYVQAFSDFWKNPATSNLSTAYLIFTPPPETTGGHANKTAAWVPDYARLLAHGAQNGSATERFRWPAALQLAMGGLVFQFISVDTPAGARRTLEALKARWQRAVPASGALVAVNPLVRFEGLSQQAYGFLWNLPFDWRFSAEAYFSVEAVFVQGSSMHASIGAQEAALIRKSGGLVSLIPLGGAVRDRRQDATAVSWRHANFIVGLELPVLRPEDAAAALDVKGSFYQVPSFVGNFMNYLGISEPVGDYPAWPERYYGGNLQRALQVKMRYDSTALFDFPYGISRAGPQARA